MEIKLGIGYGSFIFGMSEKQITDKLGEPDKKYNSVADEPYWEYHKSQVVIKFENDPDVEVGFKKLGLIEIKDRNSTLFNKSMWSYSKQESVWFLEEKLNTTHTSTDYDSFISVCFDEYWLELQFELGRLTSTVIEVILDSNEKPIWTLK